MHIGKPVFTSAAVTLAFTLLIPAANLYNGSPLPTLEEAKTQTSATINNNSAAAKAETRKYTVVKTVPKSKAVAALAKPKTGIKTAERLEPQNSKKVLSLPGTNSVKSTANPLDAVIAFFKIYNDGINNFVMYTVDEGNGISEFVAEYDDNSGVHHISYSGVYYDKTNELIYGRDDTGVFAIGFNLDVGQLTIYSAENSWQRNVGFCKLYDTLAPLICENYLTVRVTFQYDGKDWLVQLWKGIYIATMGSEIGVYQKPQDRLVEFYDCLDDANMMSMSMRLLKGDKVLFTRDLQPSWWQTGFKFTALCLPRQLTLEGSIVFPSSAMKDAFIAALNQQQAGVIRYTVEGNAVSLAW